MNKYHLTTDGSAVPYANCGGWAFVLDGPKGKKKRSGAVWQSGSNKMELWAILEGLHAIPQSAIVNVYTDSLYIINGSKKRKLCEEALWVELFVLLSIHSVSFIKVHKGQKNEDHSKAHTLAREAVFNEISTRRHRTAKISDSDLLLV